MSNETKEFDIWKDILLKNIHGKDLRNSTTIKQSKTTSNRKYQVFEILVAETLAAIDADIKWEATFGNKDGGVDIVGTKDITLMTPFVETTPEQMYLGQIKRRGKGYRFDDFKMDISKLFENYTSKMLLKDTTLMQLIFVVSSENDNNAENLRKNLRKEFKNREHITFVAGVKAPIAIIDAADILKYWKLNFQFVKNIIGNIFTDEVLDRFEKTLSDIEFTAVTASIEETFNGKIGTILEKRIKLTTGLTNIPLEVYLKWVAGSDTGSHVQLINPLGLLQDGGFYVYIDGTYDLSLFFRGITSGTYDLGQLELTFSSSIYKQVIPLGTVCFKENLFPVYQSRPNSSIQLELEKELINPMPMFFSKAILGSGGIGKSSLLNEIMIKAANDGFICINIQCPHTSADGNSFILQVFTKIINQSLHKMIFLDSLIMHVRQFLGGLYDNTWEQELENLIHDRIFCMDLICNCFVTIIIKMSYKHRCLLCFHDMHWLNDTNAEFIRKIHYELNQNYTFLKNKTIIFLEGRENETLIFNGKHHIPYAWNKLLKNTDLKKVRLKIWEKKDSQNFIDALFYEARKSFNKEIFANLKKQLLDSSGGIPMHMLEQLKFLIEKEKIALKNNGDLYIIDTNWSHLFSDDLKKLISYRVQYICHHYMDIMDFLIIYARLSLQMIPSCARYVYKLITRKMGNNIEFWSDLSVVEIKNEIICFQHEYYSEYVKQLPILNDKSIDEVLIWFENRTSLHPFEYLCKIQLMHMYLITDDAMLCEELLALLQFSVDEHIKQQAYEILLEIPLEILRANSQSPYRLRYELCESILLTGDWKLAKEHFEQLTTSINMDDILNVYYVALSYQDLANISSGELNFDESIMYSRRGIELIDAVLSDLHDNDSFEMLMQAKELLWERQAICYLFSGNLDQAIILQNKAYNSADTRSDSYVMLRVAYEMAGTKLHTNPEIAVKELEECHKQALSCNMLFSEETVLIKTMQLVGETKLASFAKDLNVLDRLYNEARALAEEMKNNIYNYSASINFVTLSVLTLLREGDINKAMGYMMKSLEKALDSRLDELLWKCYLNIAQINNSLNCKEEAIHYAGKAYGILIKAISVNPDNQDFIYQMYYEPLKCASQILEVDVPVLPNVKPRNPGLEIHMVSWKSINIYMMN